MSKEQQVQVWLGMGSNLGDRAGHLDRGLERLSERIQIAAVSPCYETEPWGVTDQPRFLNLACTGHTKLGPRELLTFVKEIERDMGRVERVRYGPRIIDIDILFYDALVLTDEDLIIPHPRLPERAFVLAPLADIAPEFVHPQSGMTIAELLSAVETDGVRRLEETEGCTWLTKKKSNAQSGISSKPSAKTRSAKDS
jgi:2-amino-4-hydroxy-6-hydroxymethyldihydropteridine diphosphokinase